MSVNLHTACPRWLNVWRYSIGREQELKAQCQKVIEQERFPFVLFYMVKLFLSSQSHLLLIL